MNEPQPRTYRPAYFLRMFVRLEDPAGRDGEDGQDGAKPYLDAKTELLAQAKVADGNLAKQVAGGGKSRSERIATQAKSRTLRRAAVAAGRSSAGARGREDELTLPPFITVPQEMTIEDRGFREADQLTATFPFQDLPLHPLICHEIRVEGWVGTVTGDDFADPDKWCLHPIPSERCVRRFNGYVDPHEMEHDEASGTIHLKARSFIAVLIDNKINPLAKAHRPQASEEYLTTYINRILEQFPPTSGQHGDPFRAYWYASPRDKEPKLSRKMLLRSLQTAASRNAAAGQTGESPVNAQPDPAGEAADPAGQGDAALGGVAGVPPKSVGEEGSSIWDLVTQACELCGVLPMYKPSLPKATGSQAGKDAEVDPANCLLISPPEAFYDGVESATAIVGGARDGFKRRFTDADGDAFGSDVRFMVWGHNLTHMKMSRKMGKARPQAVEVRAYNPDGDGLLRQMSSRFPRHVLKKKGKGAKSSGKSNEKGSGKIDAVRIFVLKGIRDQGALDAAAVSLYHQLARQELSMEIETDELASYIDPAASMQAGQLVENHNDKPDLLRLCAGTPVHVVVAKKSKENALTICSLSDFYDLAGTGIVDLLTKQQERWRAWMTDGTLDQSAIQRMAEKIQAAYRSAKLPSVYYCRAIKLEFKAGDTFFHATMELTNYMPSNDPAKLDETSREMNDRRKRKPQTAAQKNANAQKQRTDVVVDRATKIGTD